MLIRRGSQQFAQRAPGSMQLRGSPAGGAPAASAPSTLVGVLATTLLIAVLMLGGGTRSYLFSDLLLQLLAAVMLMAGLIRLRDAELTSGAHRLLLLLGVVVAVPVLQLLPVPTALLSWLPGRSEIYAEQAELGLSLPAFMPWSLDPTATLAALRSLIPAAAMLILGLQLDYAWRKRLILIVIVVAVAMVPLGVTQVAQGPHSELRPYLPTNIHDAVGLFANRNHYAALLVCALTLVYAALIADGFGHHRYSHHLLRMLGWMMLGAILILGIVLSRSRAGIGLAVVVMAVVMAQAFARRHRHRAEFRWLFGFAVICALLAFQFGFNTLVGRLGYGEADQRWQVISEVLAVAGQFGWLGTGVGSFPEVYASHESVSVLGTRILNHAHNDWAEWWVELGVLLLPLVVLAGHWLFTRVRELLAEPAALRGGDTQRRVGLLLIFLLLVHSLVDYPLRTTALSVVFALACTLAVPGNSRQQTSRAGSKRD